MTTALRYAAFTTDPAGGNPAGIVLDAAGLDDAAMQRVAADVGYPETAFLVGLDPDGARRVRYFSPDDEVPFCGHATIATSVVLAEREGLGTIRFATPVGPVAVETSVGEDGRVRAAFTSVEPDVRPLSTARRDALLTLLGLTVADLDERYPVGEPYAGNRHPVLVLRDAATFDSFGYDATAVRALMDDAGWTGTVSVLHALGPAEFEARNIFPAGTFTEDPATGSAAAAFGAYLRANGLVEPPARVVLHQGRHVGRPGLLTVDVPPAGGIVVTGTAVPIG